MKLATVGRKCAVGWWSTRSRLVSVTVVAAIAVLFSAVDSLPGAAQTQNPRNSGPTAAGTRVTCDEAPEVFELLCTAYELITRDHVDVVKDEDLAAAAADQVRTADLAERTDEAQPACPLPAPEFEEMCAVIDTVEDTAAAVELAIRGMVGSLGQDSYYMTTGQYRRFRMALENAGSSGLGVAFGLVENGEACLMVSTTCRPVIAEVYAGSPAETAGLMAGDVLVELGDAFPAEVSCANVSSLDRFDAGEEVSVTVRRGEETISTTIRADDLTIPVARGRVVDGNIGYLRLDVFSASADDKVAMVLQELTDSVISGLVLDLRDDPGGYVESAIGTAGVFLPNLSVVVHLVGRDEVDTVRARGKEVSPDPVLLPMVVVVNGGSASASEMVTGALRDQGRATVVGQTTYGKNTGQSSYRLESDGTLVGVLHITTLRWLTPRFRSATGGFQPDVIMDLPSCLLPADVARLAISAIRPRVADVAITSLPQGGGPYAIGETVEVTVTFTSPVVVNLNGGNPALRIEVGEDTRSALYKSGSGTNKLVFEYAVEQEDTDSDGISVAPDSIRTGRARIGLPSGLDAILTHDAIDPDSRHQVETVYIAYYGGGSFIDILGNAHRENIAWIAAVGITLGCNPPDNDRYCPAQPVTRAQMATHPRKQHPHPGAEASGTKA